MNELNGHGFNQCEVRGYLFCSSCSPILIEKCCCNAYVAACCTSCNSVWRKRGTTLNQNFHAASTLRLAISKAEWQHPRCFPARRANLGKLHSVAWNRETCMQRQHCGFFGCARMRVVWTCWSNRPSSACNSPVLTPQFPTVVDSFSQWPIKVQNRRNTNPILWQPYP